MQGGGKVTSAKTIRRRKHGKETWRHCPHPCSARIAPPSSKLLASPFLASIFAGAFSYLKITMLHTHIYFFSSPAPGSLNTGTAAMGEQTSQSMVHSSNQTSKHFFPCISPGKSPQPGLSTPAVSSKRYRFENTHKVTVLH